VSEDDAFEARTVDLLRDESSFAADPADSLATGHILRERYILQEKLGSGGQGIVFRALDRYRASLPHMHQFVALKVVRSFGGSSEQTLNKLRRELHCAQMLSHRNIVNVYELDKDDALVFFTMELLQGETLGSLLRRLAPQGLRRSQAWQLIQQLGAGLDHAHARGVVHGDLKPANIWITQSGELRILDFGASRLTREYAADKEEQGSSPRTPAYASYEQLRGSPAEPRDDLYALACLSYQLLQGTHPFQSQPATLARQAGLFAARPSGLKNKQWQLLQMGLSWDRADRHIPVRAWMRGLVSGVPKESRLTPLQELKPALMAQRRPMFRVASASLAACLLLALGVWQLRSIAGVAPTVMPAVDAMLPALAAAAPEVAANGETPTDPPPAPSEGRASDTPPVRARKRGPLSFSLEEKSVQSGDRFVEVRVRRNRVDGDGALAWWTEPGTAKQGEDYQAQEKALWNFPQGFSTTRFYIKLRSDSARAQRSYFYVAVAQPAVGQTAARIIRQQIWLPRTLDQVQAQR
jgi:eukaryotic-like serine/threonine-protein kinase